MSDSRLLTTGMVFLFIGVISFGGGPAIVPEMHRQLVDVHALLTAQEFTDGYALGQLGPGPNMLSVVFYGYKIAGVAGALLALAASFGPGAFLSAACGRAWKRMRDARWLAFIRRGLVPVGAGLMAAGVFVLARSTLTTLPLIVAGVASGTAIHHPASQR